MRYFLLIAGFLWSSGFLKPAAAQDLRFGLHVGPTTTDFYDRNHPIAENFWGMPTLGATFGTVGQVSIGRWGQLQVEQNVSWEGNQNHFWSKQNLNLWHLGMPVLMKFKLNRYFSIGAGFEANYLFNVTGPSEVSDGKYWNGAAIFQVEHTFLKYFACTIRYLHGFTSTSIINYVNYEGQNGTVSTYSGRRLQVSLSYLFYRVSIEPKWVEGATYYY